MSGTMMASFGSTYYDLRWKGWKMFGTVTRLNRILDPVTKRTVIAPVDDDALSGPEGGLHDLRTTVQEIVTGGANAILGFRGTFQRCEDLIPPEVGRIFNLTMSTTRGEHTRKILVGSVESALMWGADGVAVHFNLSSPWEPENLEILGAVGSECARHQMPLLVLAYPRTVGPDGRDYNYHDVREADPEAFARLVRHAVRVGVELGADVIKTIYTGTPESFQTVTESAMGVPVVIAGEARTSPLGVLTKLQEAMQAGAAGVASGRNAFNSEHVAEMIGAFGDVVHRDMEAEVVLRAHPVLAGARVGS